MECQVFAGTTRRQWFIERENVPIRSQGRQTWEGLTHGITQWLMVYAQTW